MRAQSFDSSRSFAKKFIIRMLLSLARSHLSRESLLSLDHDHARTIIRLVLRLARSSRSSSARCASCSRAIMRAQSFDSSRSFAKKFIIRVVLLLSLVRSSLFVRIINYPASCSRTIIMRAQSFDSSSRSFAKKFILRTLLRELMIVSQILAMYRALNPHRIL